MANLETAVERLRRLVELAPTYVKPYTRVVHGRKQYVDGYWVDEGKKVVPPTQRKLPQVVPINSKEALDNAIAATRLWVKENLGTSPGGALYDKIKAQDSTKVLDQALPILGDVNVRDGLKARIAMFNEMKSKEGFTKSDTIVAGRERGRLETLLEASRLAARMQSGNITQAEVDAKLAYLQTRMSKDAHAKVFSYSYPTNPPAILAVLEHGAKKFAEGKMKKALPFDLNDPSLSKGQLMTYVKSKGGKYVGAMTKDELKDWILADLGDAAVLQKYGTSDKANVKQTLQDKGQKKLVDGHAKAAAAKAAQQAKSVDTAPFAEGQTVKVLPSDGAFDGLVGEVVEVDSEDVYVAFDEAEEVQAGASYAFAPEELEIVTSSGESATSAEGKALAKMLALHKAKASLKTAYKKGQEVILQDPEDPNVWEIKNLTGLKADQTLSIDDVAALVTGEEGWVVSNLAPAKTPLQAQIAGAPTAATPKPYINAWIKANGGNYTGKMTTEQKMLWIRFHLQGNEVGKFAIEKVAAKKEKGSGAHKWADVHPGSPDSALGKLAVKSMADYIATRSWGKDFLDHGANVAMWTTPGGVVAAAQDFGLWIGTPYADAASAPADVRRKWVADFAVAMQDAEIILTPTEGVKPSAPEQPKAIPPKKKSYDDYLANNPGNPYEVDPFDWTLVENYEKVDPNEVLTQLGKFASYTDAQANEALSIIHDAVPEIAENAPLPVKRLFLTANYQNQKEIKHVIIWKAEKGHYGLKKASAAAVTAATKSYAPLIAKGKTAHDDIFQSWPVTAVLEYLQDHGLPVSSSTIANVKKVSEHLGAKAEAAAPKPKPAPVKPKPVKLVFTAAPNKNIGGMHKKGFWKDQNGKEYVSKAFANDPNSKARVDAEHAGNLIGRLHGFNQPWTDARTMPNGQYSYLQEYIPDLPKPVKGTIPPSKLSDEVLFQIAQEHVLDWIISNHDSHDDNFLMREDRVMGVDKGQAFKFFPNDKLAVGYLPPGNGAPVYYDEIYKAITSKAMSKERADRLVLALLRRAKRMSSQHEEEHRSLLELAMKARTSFPNGMTREQFVGALMERKHNAAQDFYDLYKGLYAKAGYSWDFPSLDNIASGTIEAKGRTLYVGSSQELVDASASAQVHGVPAFFAGTELEDVHLLVYQEKQSDGGAQLVAEGRFREEADAKIVSWLQSQTIENKAGFSAQEQSAITTGAVLPNNDKWYSAISAAAKTVNHHASDGEYNQATLTSMASAKNEMEAAKALVGNWAKSHPGDPYPGGSLGVVSIPKLLDVEQQKAFLEMLTEYLDYVATVEHAKNTGGKTYGDPSDPKYFTPFTYTPKPKPKVVNEWQDADGTIVVQELDDGSWLKLNKDANTSAEISATEANELTSTAEFTQAVSAGVSVGNIPLKIFKHKNSHTSGSFNIEQGVLMTSGGEQTGGAPGHEYDVVAGDITIEYRAHAEHVAAHKGLMRIRVRNFNGTEAQFNQALDIVRQMGADLSPADEQQLELFYWRHLYGVANDRQGRDTGDIAKTRAAIKKAYQTNPHMSAVEELKMLRDAWAITFGKKVVDEADFMPHVGHARLHTPGARTGRPYWYRPDITESKLLDLWKDRLPYHDVTYGGNEDDLRAIMKSGVLISYEERLRMLGINKTGASSHGDQTSKGASAYIYNRQGSSAGTCKIYLRPRAFMRTTNYSLPNDSGWGDIKRRPKEAPWDFAAATKYTGGGNQTQIKYMLTVLDDMEIVVFPSESMRKDVISFFKKFGIEEIRGVPIEERFVVTSTYGGSVSAVMAKFVKKMRAEEAANAS